MFPFSLPFPSNIASRLDSIDRHLRQIVQNQITTIKQVKELQKQMSNANDQLMAGEVKLDRLAERLTVLEQYAVDESTQITALQEQLTQLQNTTSLPSDAAETLNRIVSKLAAMKQAAEDVIPGPDPDAAPPLPPPPPPPGDGGGTPLP